MGAASPTMIGAGSSAVSSFGQAYVQSQALRAQGRLEERASDMNARLIALQAESALSRGRTAELRHRGSVRQLAGAQRAALAAQGIDVGAGSARDIALETATLGEMDAQTIRNNTYREVFGYEIAESRTRYRGKSAKRTASERAGSTLLTGGLRAASDIFGGVYKSNKLTGFLT